MSKAIEIENLYKEYRLGVIGYGTLREDAQSWWASVRGKEDPNSILFHTNQSNEGRVPDHILALDDINLTVEKGERLGIIGKNGAGKTTLLKILAQIASPTKGTAKIKGRVASLIAVGTGFHSELTGRENVYLNGSILGLKKWEINERFDEIVDFSGVEQFIDTPVKRYSSGMNIRLGFAVAAHLDPDVLIVDEVLAVGDYEFQKKCIGKMNDASSQGRTILFVSHNLGSVRDLCSRTILLEGGKKIRDGHPEEVISYYTSSSDEVGGERIFALDSSGKNSAGDEIVKLNAVRSLDDSGEVCNQFTVRDDIYVQIEYDLFLVKKTFEVQIFLTNQLNNHVFFSYDYQNKRSLDEKVRKPGRYISTCKIPGDLLNDNNYSVTVKLVDTNNTFCDEVGCSFNVDDSKHPDGARGQWSQTGNWPRVAVRPILEWDVKYNSF